MRLVLYGLSLSVVLISLTTVVQAKETSTSAAEKAERLLSRMTIEEKVGQLNQLSAHGTDEKLVIASRCAKHALVPF